jgi:hypothetical protein
MTAEGGFMRKAFLIYVISVLFVFNGNCALADGLQTGASVKAMKKNELIAGRLVAVNVEKEPFTIILPAGATLKVEFKNIQRIEDTNTTKKITPSYSYTESNYKIYRFTFIDGKIVEGAVPKWPIFDVDTGTTGIQKNIWLEHLSFIEAGEGISASGSLKTGAKVEYSRDKNIVRGMILAMNVGKDPFTIILPAGTTLRVDFKNITKIEATGDKKKITPSYSSTAGTYKMYRFYFVDGKTVEGAVATWPIFDVDTGTTGIQKNIWLEYLEYIKAIE